MNIQDKRINAISVYLLDIGVKPNYKGFMYLNTAIQLVIDNKNIIPNITNVLYPKIAKIYKQTPSKVERNIRFAIENSNDEYKNMSNKEFIAFCALNITLKGGK